MNTILKLGKKFSCARTVLFGYLSLFYVSNCFAACGLTSQTPEAIDFFAKRPDAFLGGYPAGGKLMQASVENILTTPPKSIEVIRGSLLLANTEQKKAIGVGLARAHIRCRSTNKEVDLSIIRFTESLVDEITKNYFEKELYVADQEDAAPHLYSLQKRNDTDSVLKTRPGPLFNPFAPMPIK